MGYDLGGQVPSQEVFGYTGNAASPPVMFVDLHTPSTIVIGTINHGECQASRLDSRYGYDAYVTDLVNVSGLIREI